MAIKTTEFDVLDYLKTQEELAEYLRVALEDGDAGTIAIVLGDIARARGASQFSKETGLSRETIYKAFCEGGNPTLDTLSKAVKALGFRLTIEPMSSA